MAKFHSKPVEIEAVQLTRALIESILFDKAAMPNGLFSRRAAYHPTNRTIEHASFGCHTRQGDVAADEGDWIIQESDGSGCYPCKPDVFAAKYEPVDG